MTTAFSTALENCWPETLYRAAAKGRSAMEYGELNYGELLKQEAKVI
jgi:hypothetical protein